MASQDEPMSKKNSSAKSHDIIFTIARMNPPTSGHMHLIKFLVAEAIKLKKRTIYILLQAGEKAGREKKNPLYCDEKKIYLSKMIANSQLNNQLNPQVNIVIICADESFLDPSTNEPICNTSSTAILSQICYMCTLENVKAKDQTNLHLFIGEDRVEDFTKFLGTGEPGTKSYLPSNQKTFYHKIDRPLDEMGNPLGISATKVRAMALKDNSSEFIKEEIVAGLTSTEANELYTLLHERMSALPDTYKKVTSKAASRKIPRVPGEKIATKSVSRKGPNKVGGRKYKRTRKGKKTRKNRKTRKYR
jgi:hypothetical protein